MSLAAEELMVLESGLAMVRAAIAVDYPKSPYAPNPDQAKAHLQLAEWAAAVMREQYRAAAAALARPDD